MDKIREWAMERLDDVERVGGKHAMTREGLVGRLVLLCELVAWTYGIGTTQSLHPQFFPDLDFPDMEVISTELDAEFVARAVGIAREVIGEVEALSRPADGQA